MATTSKPTNISESLSNNVIFQIITVSQSKKKIKMNPYNIVFFPHSELVPTWTNSSWRSFWNFLGSVVMETGPISGEEKQEIKKHIHNILIVCKSFKKALHDHSFVKSITTLPQTYPWGAGVFKRLTFFTLIKEFQTVRIRYNQSFFHRYDLLMTVSRSD